MPTWDLGFADWKCALGPFRRGQTAKRSVHVIIVAAVALSSCSQQGLPQEEDIAIEGVSNVDQATWDPLKAPPAVHDALAAKLGTFTVMVDSPKREGVTCGTVMQPGKKNRFFIFDGELMLEPEVDPDNLDDGLRLASFSQSLLSLCRS